MRGITTCSLTLAALLLIAGCAPQEPATQDYSSEVAKIADDAWNHMLEQSPYLQNRQGMRVTEIPDLDEARLPAARLVARDARANRRHPARGAVPRRRADPRVPALGQRDRAREASPTTGTSSRSRPTAPATWRPSRRSCWRRLHLRGAEREPRCTCSSSASIADYFEQSSRSHRGPGRARHLHVEARPARHRRHVRGDARRVMRRRVTVAPERLESDRRRTSARLFTPASTRSSPPDSSRPSTICSTCSTPTTTRPTPPTRSGRPLSRTARPTTATWSRPTRR